MDTITIEAATIEALRTDAALAADAASTEATYGDHCYVCGVAHPAHTVVVNHPPVNGSTVTTDEAVCEACAKALALALA